MTMDIGIELITIVYECDLFSISTISHSYSQSSNPARPTLIQFSYVFFAGSVWHSRRIKTISPIPCQYQYSCSKQVANLFPPAVVTTMYSASCFLPNTIHPSSSPKFQKHGRKQSFIQIPALRYPEEQDRR